MFPGSVHVCCVVVVVTQSWWQERPASSAPLPPLTAAGPARSRHVLTTAGANTCTRATSVSPSGWRTVRLWAGMSSPPGTSSLQSSSYQATHSPYKHHQKIIVWYLVFSHNQHQLLINIIWVIREFSAKIEIKRYDKWGLVSRSDIWWGDCVCQRSRQDGGPVRTPDPAVSPAWLWSARTPSSPAPPATSPSAARSVWTARSTGTTSARCSPASEASPRMSLTRWCWLSFSGCRI